MIEIVIVNTVITFPGMNYAGGVLVNTTPVIQLCTSEDIAIPESRPDDLEDSQYILGVFQVRDRSLQVSIRADAAHAILLRLCMPFIARSSYKKLVRQKRDNFLVAE
jgi:hypothetical protein